jgi:hypothetical protein
MEAPLKLFTSILIYFGDHPDSFLEERMREAAKQIKLEEIRSDSYLCEETCKALRKYKLREKK